MVVVDRDLGGRVAIVGLEQAEVARRLVAEGATVVLVGHDADVAGALLAEIEALTSESGPPGAGRAAFFRLSGAAPGSQPDPGSPGASSGPTGSELDALVEFVASQWPAR